MFLRIFTAFIIIAALSACHSTPAKKNAPPPVSVTPPKADPQPFFDYDAIDRYFYDADEQEVFGLISKERLTKLETFRSAVLLGNKPERVSEPGFTDSLEKAGYKRTVVDPNKFPEISNIFMYKPSTEHLSTACLFVYRNILIFKKKNKVVGIAKICFGCLANQIKGANANTDNFGDQGDYERLKQILDR